MWLFTSDNNNNTKRFINSAINDFGGLYASYFFSWHTPQHHYFCLLGAYSTNISHRPTNNNRENLTLPLLSKLALPKKKNVTILACEKRASRKLYAQSTLFLTVIWKSVRYCSCIHLKYRTTTNAHRFCFAHQIEWNVAWKQKVMNKTKAAYIVTIYTHIILWYALIIYSVSDRNPYEPCEIEQFCFISCIMRLCGCM